MTYEITNNTQFNSIEIKFDCKPSEAVRDALKDLKFRWHKVKKVWYGYADRSTVVTAIEGTKSGVTTDIKQNKFGVKVGDIFSTSWGYDQTNVDFFQVVELVGNLSVRVREVYPERIKEEPTCGMAADRTYRITRDLLPVADRSVFIKDQERGDIKRLKSYAADGISNPVFNLSSFAMAHLCSNDEITVYESWYA